MSYLPTEACNLLSHFYDGKMTAIVTKLVTVLALIFLYDSIEQVW